MTSLAVKPDLVKPPMLALTPISKLVCCCRIWTCGGDNNLLYTNIYFNNLHDIRFWLAASIRPQWDNGTQQSKVEPPQTEPGVLGVVNGCDPLIKERYVRQASANPR